MAYRPVSIALDTDTGDLIFKPYSLRVKVTPGHEHDESRSDTVHWLCDDDFVIMFGTDDGTPLNWVLSPQAQGDTGKQFFHKGVQPGIYHYTAVVAKRAEGEAVKILLVVGCPDIIVEFGP